MTYNELRVMIADFLNRDDLTDAITGWIDLAEAGLQRSVRHWRMEKRDTLTMTGRYTALPADYVEMVRLTIGRPVTLVRPDVVASFHKCAPDHAGTPTSYAISGNEVELWPGSTADAEIRYYAALPKLRDVETNWLLDIAPEAYLYGALVASAPFLTEDARMTTWAALYETAVSGVNADGDKGRYGTKLVMRNA